VKCEELSASMVYRLSSDKNNKTSLSLNCNTTDKSSAYIFIKVDESLFDKVIIEN
jgi:hypothetical protein